ncbi:MAG: hypothetical protein O3C45_03530 [Bacteroidetes bacterium]|nr:hypothetical protein [Bacteroidota bacterium]MDA0874113.1 hypothetical protein [Bacteroidota bacterium]
MLPPNVMPLRNAEPSRGSAGAPREVYYVQPTLDELMGLCRDFNLISDIRVVGERYVIQCKEERFDVSATEAAFLVRGLLIGHFAFHTRDDLSLANWAH